MRKFLITLFFIILPFLTHAQRGYIHKVDRDKSFGKAGKIRIGTEKRKIKSLIEFDKSTGDYYYSWFTTPNNSLIFNGIKLKNTRYGFFNDKVFAIEAEFDSVDRLNLIKTLRNLYGGERQRYTTGYFTSSDGMSKLHGVSIYHSHDDWPGEKIRINIYSYPSNVLEVSLTNAEVERIINKIWRKKEKEEWKEEWKGETGWVKRDAKKEFKNKIKEREKEDKEKIEYLRSQYQNNTL